MPTNQQIISLRHGCIFSLFCRFFPLGRLFILCRQCGVSLFRLCHQTALESVAYPLNLKHTVWQMGLSWKRHSRPRKSSHKFCAAYFHPDWHCKSISALSHIDAMFTSYPSLLTQTSSSLLFILIGQAWHPGKWETVADCNATAEVRRNYFLVSNGHVSGTVGIATSLYLKSIWTMEENYFFYNIP